MEDNCNSNNFDKCVICHSYDDCAHKQFIEKGRHYYVIPLAFLAILVSVYLLFI